jgi:hypothetical protein
MNIISTIEKNNLMDTLHIEKKKSLEEELKMSKIISNQTELKGLEFQLETLKKDFKNQNIPCKGNLNYHRIQNAISRCKKRIEAEETSSSQNLPNLKKTSSPKNVVELSEETQSIHLKKTNKIKSTALENLSSADLVGEVISKKEHNFFKINPSTGNISLEKVKVACLNRLYDQSAAGILPNVDKQKKAISFFLNSKLDDMTLETVYESELLNDMLVFIKQGRHIVPYDEHEVMEAFVKHHFTIMIDLREGNVHSWEKIGPLKMAWLEEKRIEKLEVEKKLGVLEQAMRELAKCLIQLNPSESYQDSCIRQQLEHEEKIRRSSDRTHLGPDYNYNKFKILKEQNINECVLRQEAVRRKRHEDWVQSEIDKKQAKDDIYIYESYLRECADEKASLDAQNLKKKD